VSLRVRCVTLIRRMLLLLIRRQLLPILLVVLLVVFVTLHVPIAGYSVWSLWNEFVGLRLCVLVGLRLLLL
jgi:hypothetical protein